ncbi:MAG TPA: hypothetical protein VFR30_03420 [Lysobacter sp.]|nr:hypothetical protein [Lysobacter sp.]
MKAARNHLDEPGNRRLDSARFGAPPGVARPAGKAVVHSSNNFVTSRPRGRFQARMTRVFHAQPIDFERHSDDGTFFANLYAVPLFPALRACGGIDSTDLSTTRVDKHESPFTSDSCVTYVMFEERMTRNCNAACGPALASGLKRSPLPRPDAVFIAFPFHDLASGPPDVGCS